MYMSSDQLRKPLYQAERSQIFLQQMFNKQKQYQIHAHNKNLEDFDHIQMTSPTQNLVADESIFYQQERKKCLNCIHNQKRLSKMDDELNHEKKKNLKFLKIINAKVEKEKQLQHAYRHIAKQLKKRIDDAINSEVHELVSNQQKRQNQEINAINIKLLQAQQQLRHKMQTIRLLNEKTNSLWNNSSIINGGQKKFSISLDPKVNNIKFQPKAVKNTINLSIYHYPISVDSIIALQQQFEDAKEDPNICEEQTSQQKYINKGKSQKDQQMVEDYIFEKQNSSKNYSQLELKQVQANKPPPRKSQSFQQFKTVIQGQEQNSFRSIQTSRLSDKFLQSLSVIDPGNLNEQQSKSCKQKQSYYTIHQGGLQISQISNVSLSKEEPNRASEKQMLDHFMSYSNQIIEQKDIDTPINRCQSLATSNKISTEMSINNQLNAQRQKINRFNQCMQYFFERLSAKLNFYGEKYKSSTQIPKQLILFADSPKIKSNNQILTIDNEKIQEILKMILQQLQQIFKNQKKQSDKTVNDQLLYISDLQNKYNDLITHNKCLEKTIEGYQIHKSFMEIKILELQEKQINSDKETKKSSVLMPKFSRKVSLFKYQNTKSEQTQCTIVPSDIVRTMEHLQQRNAQFANVLHIVPNILNELSPADVRSQYVLNFQENVKDQIETMLKDSIEMLLTKQSSFQNEDMLKQARSASYCNNLSLHECSKSMLSLDAQNQQLKSSLKQKDEEILNFSQKITLQNIEMANNDRLIQNLKIEIYQLKNWVKAKETNNSQSKVDHFQSISPQPTPTKQIRSQSGVFLEYDDKKQYNNLYYDRDQQVKQLKQKLLYCQVELNKYWLQHKKNKKKIIYINN